MEMRKETLVLVLKIAYFVIASVLLCSVWFVYNHFLFDEPQVIVSNVTNLPEYELIPENLFLLPLGFNASFWGFMRGPLGSNPFGVPVELVFVLFTLVTFPILALVFYGLVRGVAAGHKPSVLVAICLVLSLFVLYNRSAHGLRMRYMVQFFPLLGIPICYAVMQLKKKEGSAGKDD